MENKVKQKDNFLHIPRQLLVCVYLVVPLLVLMTLADIYYFDASLLPYMGVEALLLPIFIFVFNLPHIIASFFGFLDKEYIHHYRKHLFVYLPVLLVAVGLMLYVNYIVGLVFYLVFDIWHSIKQKVGIALILGARPTLSYKLWMWLAFITISLAYVQFILPELFSGKLAQLVYLALFVGMVGIFFAMIRMLLVLDKKVRWYIVGVSSLFFASYFFILSGYMFLAVLAFRFVHDVSAFAFYITHDHNRKLQTQNNWLYKLLAIVPLPVLILTPLLSYLFAYVVRTSTNGLVISYSIIVLLGVAHFYLEGVMWKRESPHRKFVRVR